jgi:hypothetical protein
MPAKPLPHWEIVVVCSKPPCILKSGTRVTQRIPASGAEVRINGARFKITAFSLCISFIGKFTLQLHTGQIGYTLLTNTMTTFLQHAFDHHS